MSGDSFLENFVLSLMVNISVQTSLNIITSIVSTLPMSQIFTSSLVRKQFIQSALHNLSRSGSLRSNVSGRVYPHIWRFSLTFALHFPMREETKKLGTILNASTNDGLFSRISKNMLNGAFAGTCTAAAVYPFRLNHTRQLSSLKAMCNQEGVRGLYRGFCLYSSLSSLYRAFYFGFYDSATTKESSIFSRCVWATTSTFAALAMCEPLNAAFVSLQAETHQLARNPAKMSQVLEITREIARKEGLSSLYRDFSGTLTRQLPPAACMLFGFDLLRNVYQATKYK